MANFLGLEDVEQTARENPDTFFLPAIEERKSQRVGDSVRLHFIIKNPADGEPRAERMWVTVTQTHGFLRPYKGKLQNLPAYIEDLKPGAEIRFKPCHIARTIIKKGDPGWIDGANLKAFVSEMCFQSGECVRFLYREAPDSEGGQIDRTRVTAPFLLVIKGRARLFSRTKARLLTHMAQNDDLRRDLHGAIEFGWAAHNRWGINAEGVRHDRDGIGCPERQVGGT